jgi:hypothetical protein
MLLSHNVGDAALGKKQTNIALTSYYGFFAKNAKNILFSVFKIL